jgi:hypothetical protein
MDTASARCALFSSGDLLALILLPLRAINVYSYAFTKNLTHEPAAGRMQSPPGQHPIISTAVPYGYKSNCHFVENCRF